ncbi:outer membrane lipoprotein carrier protein LolA [Maricaulis sp.]|uniref:LolA family protein n=1 Tax=Maricaulis sp. TaxID=1486257 RepID=UPI0026190AA5|nr:outer membrane lipoprotein carrier protein LolA [Maricaulis sp.]
MFTTLLSALLIQVSEPGPATLHDPAPVPVLAAALVQETTTPVANQPDETGIEPAAATLAPEAVFNEQAAIAGINAYLNSMQTLRARFLQISPSGAGFEGLLSISRPGRLRFEYDDPSPITVIADGTTVAMEDSKLETVDRAPLRSTPLWWLLKDEIDIAADAEITQIVREFGLIYLTVRDPNGEMDGQIQFVFEEPSYELREWFVTDALGEMTRIILQDHETDVRLSPRLFIIPDPEDERDSRRGRR